MIPSRVILRQKNGYFLQKMGRVTMGVKIIFPGFSRAWTLRMPEKYDEKTPVALSGLLKEINFDPP
jgi:hypothetical protein